MVWYLKTVHDMRPTKAVSMDHYYCLSPAGMPYHILRSLPFEYAIALASTATVDYVSIYNNEYGKSNVYGAKFMTQYRALEKVRAVDRAEGQL